MQLTDFDDIRPFSDEEIRPAVNELLRDPQFDRILKGFLPLVPRFVRNAAIKALFLNIKTATDFQVTIMRSMVNLVLRRSSTGHTFDHQAIANQHERYTFISNHRDIVLDSAILNILLMDINFPTTLEIGIGDNLLIQPWIRTLVRINKSFIVRRGLAPRELLMASKHMSQYMHYVINVKRDNIWLAQREGRAKDSSDRTQEAVLKMLAMGGEGTVIERIKDMHIVPLTISYEYDPCDYLKAMEFQLKRDNPDWKKSKQDDMTNMATGIKGQKGHIHYHASPCINTWVDELEGVHKNEVFTALAERIDRVLHKAYRLYPCNYIAEDLLTGIPHHVDKYTHKEKKEFEAYVQSRLDLIDIPNKDDVYLRERILTQYANPVRNYEAAKDI